MTLVNAMKQRRVTQKQLAIDCSVTQVAVHYWCKGEYLPKAPVVPVIEKVLNAKVSWPHYAKGKLQLTLAG